MGSGAGFKPATWHFHPTEFDLTSTNAFLNLEREPESKLVTLGCNPSVSTVPPPPQVKLQCGGQESNLHVTF
jgi:hypothetical protein